MSNGNRPLPISTEKLGLFSKRAQCSTLLATCKQPPEWEFIVQYWAEWAFGLLGTAIIAVAIKYKALLDGVLAILHDRIYQACQHYIQQGYIDASGLKNLEYLYRSYHTLGGNGTGTELYNRAKALPIHDN